MRTARSEAPEDDGPATVRPRVVYTNAPLQLARLIERDGAAWALELGGERRTVEAGPDVDPALLDEVLERGGRVLVESTSNGALTIAGVVQTQRTLTVDADGEVNVDVKAFRVRAERELLLSSAHAFVRIKRKDIELYGGEVLTRAREVARIIGRLISLN